MSRRFETAYGSAEDIEALHALLGLGSGSHVELNGVHFGEQAVSPCGRRFMAYKRHKHHSSIGHKIKEIFDVSELFKALAQV